MIEKIPFSGYFRHGLPYTTGRVMAPIDGCFLVLTCIQD